MERNSHYANFRRLSNLVRFRSFPIALRNVADCPN